MSEEAAFDPERFFELARRVGHGKALGLEYRASGPNWMELCLPWREELVGVPETGVLASGAIVSLIDTASGASVWMTLGHFVPIVTLDLRLDYMRPAVKGETVIARCESVPAPSGMPASRMVRNGGDWATFSSPQASTTSRP